MPGNREGSPAGGKNGSIEVGVTGTRVARDDSDNTGHVGTLQKKTLKGGRW